MWLDGSEGLASTRHETEEDLGRWVERAVRLVLPLPPEGLCEVFDIPYDGARRAEIEAMSLDQLEALVARLKRERRWG